MSARHHPTELLPPLIAALSTRMRGDLEHVGRRISASCDTDARGLLLVGDLRVTFTCLADAAAVIERQRHQWESIHRQVVAASRLRK